MGELQESGGDNLAANFSRELADYTIYVAGQNLLFFWGRSGAWQNHGAYDLILLGLGVIVSRSWDEQVFFILNRFFLKHWDGDCWKMCDSSWRLFRWSFDVPFFQPNFCSAPKKPTFQWGHWCCRGWQGPTKRWARWLGGVHQKLDWFKAVLHWKWWSGNIWDDLGGPFLHFENEISILFSWLFLRKAAWAIVFEKDNRPLVMFFQVKEVGLRKCTVLVVFIPFLDLANCFLPSTAWQRAYLLGITQSDLLIINKVDLARAVGADLAVMDRDAKKRLGRRKNAGRTCGLVMP